MKFEKEERRLAELRELLNEAASGMSEARAEKVVRSLAAEFKAFDTIPDMKFLAFFDPRTVPSDGRVRFVYTPTYLACAIIVCAVGDYPDLLNDEQTASDFSLALNGSTGRRFLGHGFDDIDGFLEAMDIFARCDILAFAKKNPQISPTFTKAIGEAADFLENYLRTDGYVDPWGSNPYKKRAAEIYERMTKNIDKRINVFVYGTLMKGQSAEHYLYGSEYKGRYMLKNHAMYDLGAFPGIVERKGESVVGEVYEADESLLAQLDMYEGEGQLYIRTPVRVTDGSDSVTAYAYIYNNDMTGSACMRTMWGMRDDDEVWYASYGTNLSDKRFDCYISGGVCKENGKPYEGCRDKTRWTDETVMTFDGELYFGGESPSWGMHGVAFFDPEGEGKTHMRLYKIKLSQLFDIQKQEGASDNWYGRIVCLGIRDGAPIYTLTSERRKKPNAPGRSQIKLIAKAMKKNLHLSDNKVLEIIMNAFEV